MKSLLDPTLGINHGLKTQHHLSRYGCRSFGYSRVWRLSRPWLLMDSQREKRLLPAPWDSRDSSSKLREVKILNVVWKMRLGRTS